MTKQDVLIEAFAEKYCTFFWRNWNRDAFSNKETIIADLNALISQIVPGEEEIDEKKNDIYSKYEYPDNDEQMNHNDNMERYHRGFDVGCSFIINRLTGKE